MTQAHNGRFCRVMRTVTATLCLVLPLQVFEFIGMIIYRQVKNKITISKLLKNKGDTQL